MKKLDDYTMNLIQKNGFIVRIFERTDDVSHPSALKAVTKIDGDGNITLKKSGEDAYERACDKLVELIQGGYTLDSKDHIISLPVTVRCGTSGKVIYNVEEGHPVMFEFRSQRPKSRRKMMSQEVDE